ncbi:MAG: hypothetical protein KDD58_05490 [Bdellovibrionales bacterium]|nr:hypothetical protein [Bdellovibrionales bacterium]
MVKTLYKIKNRSKVYWQGIRHFCMHPYKLSQLIAENSPVKKTLPNNLIRRVKSHFHGGAQLEVTQLSAEQCQVTIWRPKEGAVLAKEVTQLNPYLFGVEECLFHYWQNAMIISFAMQFHKADLQVNFTDHYPVECLFSMDIEEKNQVERELIKKGRVIQKVNLTFSSRGIEIGHCFVEFELSTQRLLPAN